MCEAFDLLVTVSLLKSCQNMPVAATEAPPLPLEPLSERRRVNVSMREQQVRVEAKVGNGDLLQGREAWRGAQEEETRERTTDECLEHSARVEITFFPAFTTTKTAKLLFIFYITSTFSVFSESDLVPNPTESDCFYAVWIT